MSGVISTAPQAIIPLLLTRRFTDTPDVTWAGTAAATVLSGALTANTYANLISVNTPGVLEICGLVPVDATARTITLSILVNGQEIFVQGIATSATTSSLIGVGAPASKDGSNLVYVIPEPLRFTTSLLIRIKSTLTETDKLRLYYQYYTTQG